MGQRDACARAYPVVCARGLVCRTRVCTVVCEGDIIPYIKSETIRNYEWYGSSLLPSVCDVADTEWEYLFGNDGVLYYVLHESVRVSGIGYEIIIDDEYVHDVCEGGSKGVFVSIILSYDLYD